MKPALLTAFVALLLCNAPITAQQTNGSFAKAGLMRVRFESFEEVTDPKTARKEYVFTVLFLGLAPKGELKTLRRGEQFAGYTVGEFINREPVWLPNDGYKAGTLPTLQLIHTKTGEKHVLEPEKLYALPREK